MAKSMSKANKLMRDVLRRSIQILSKEGAWTKSAEARNEEGFSCDFNSPNACKFCAVGAVKRAIVDEKGKYDFSLFNDIEEMLDKEVRRHTKYMEDELSPEARGYDNIVSFNDYFAKDKRYIIRRMQAVIDSLKTSK